MPLPSSGIFLKDDTIVGCGFCDIGWFISIPGMKRCILECMKNAEDYYINPDKHGPYWRDKYGSYFPTDEKEFYTFDRILIYDHVIPRKVAMVVFLDDFTDEEWKFVFNTHCRLSTEEEMNLSLYKKPR